jgi:quercetin dioxygenase-like cupin family protein
MTVRWNWIRALVIMLGAAAVVGESARAPASDPGPMVAMSPQTMTFAPIPTMPRCASGAILRGNPRSGPAWVLLKLASGCRVPWHWHSANEDLVIVSGRGTMEMKDGPPLQFVPGAYVSLPNHHVHRASCSRACLLFSIADGAFDIHYVDTSGKEIDADRALGQSAKTKRMKK